MYEDSGGKSFVETMFGQMIDKAAEYDVHFDIDVTQVQCGLYGFWERLYNGSRTSMH